MTRQLPQGIKDVSVEDLGTGDLLMITTESGFVITIDVLGLAEHEGTVAVQTLEGLENGDAPVACIAFDKSLGIDASGPYTDARIEADRAKAAVILETALKVVNRCCHTPVTMYNHLQLTAGACVGCVADAIRAAR